MGVALFKLDLNLKGSGSHTVTSRPFTAAHVICDVQDVALKLQLTAGNLVYQSCAF